MKIGIVTLYHNNFNYGGLLQAYALQHVLNNLGHESEQISYANSSRTRYFLARTKNIFRLMKTSKLKKRRKTTKRFAKKIPHSKLYFKSNINNLNKYYDGFVVGSDQVWNPLWINRFFKLDFANDNKLKVAYAASITKSSLTKEEERMFLELFKKFNAVSLREQLSVDLFKDKTEVNLISTLDPTLLLSKEEWDEVVSNPIIEGDYLFCYFLSGNKTIREYAAKYAKNNNLKLVTIPFLSNTYRNIDLDFGDQKIMDAGPSEFISLIKHAKIVFTDSFHGSVFSHLYSVPFFCFGLHGDKSDVRLETLTNLFNTSDRYIQNPDKIKYDYFKKEFSKVQISENYLKEKEKSLNFLKEAIK